MQQSEERPSITTNTTLALPVFILDGKFVVCTVLGEGKYALPIVPVQPKWGIDVALKKFMTEVLHLDFTSLIPKLDTSLPVYFHMDAQANSRVFQNAFVFNVTQADIDGMTPPDGFVLLALDGVLDAPEELLFPNHHRIISAAAEVGK